MTQQGWKEKANVLETGSEKELHTQCFMRPKIVVCLLGLARATLELWLFSNPFLNRSCSTLRPPITPARPYTQLWIQAWCCLLRADQSGRRMVSETTSVEIPTFWNDEGDTGRVGTISVTLKFTIRPARPTSQQPVKLFSGPLEQT